MKASNRLKAFLRKHIGYYYDNKKGIHSLDALFIYKIVKLFEWVLDKIVKLIYATS